MERPGDTTPEPRGGRAAERLRLFEEARRPPAEQKDDSLIRTPAKGSKRTKSGKKRSHGHAKQARRKE